MTTIRIRSIDEPFDDPATVRSAVSLLSRAETMGFLGGDDIDHLGMATVREVIDAMTEAGLGAGPGAVFRLSDDEIGETEIAAVINELEEVLESSPAPGREWQSLEKLFGVEDLAGLLSISTASVRRYSRGDRSTPDGVADRLHFVAMVVSDLMGAYNDFGIRRWFGRSRNALGGAAPRDLLGGDWNSDDPGPRRVRELARSLLGSPAT